MTEPTTAGPALPVENRTPAVVFLDSQYRVRSCNSAFESLFLYAQSEIAGQRLDQLMATEDTAADVLELKQRLLAGRPVFETATFRHRKDGTRVYVEIHGVPLVQDDSPTGSLVTYRDITPRRDVELELRMLTKALETTQLGVTLTDPSGKILFTNRADAEMHGHEVSELLDQDVRTFAPEDLWNPMPVDELRRLRSRRRETVNKRKDGSTFPVQLLSDVVTDHDGEPIAVVTTCEDITQRKEVERQLKILGKVFQTTKLGVTVTDTDGKIMYANPAEAQMHGCEVRDLINKDVRIFAPKELWNPLSVDQISRLGSRRRETINVRQDGSVFPVQLASEVVVGQTGEPIAVVTTCEDISLTTAIEQVAEAILVTDPEGTIQYVNPAFESITEYPSTEALDRDWRVILSKHDEAFHSEMWDRLMGGEVWQGQLTNRKKDGSVFEAAATVSPVRDPTGKIMSFVFVFRDITEKIIFDQQRREAQKMEAIGRLAGGVAHDFNNLLVAIQAHLSFAMGAVPPGVPGHEDLQEVQRAADRATSLTRQLLAFGRRQILQPKDLALNELVSEMMKMLRRVIGENIELVLIPGPKLGVIHADPGQIEQVVMNLCVNARDAMPEGGTMTIKTKNAELDADFCKRNPWARPGRFVLLLVNDTGCGMGDETLSHAFEPFFTTKQVNQGTGLGLATVYGIVEQHGGLVHTVSQPGLGTSFELYFSIVDHEPAANTKVATEAPAGGKETILLAEDDAMVVRPVVQVLQEAGYTVLTAENGLEAVRLYEEDPDRVDLALLDLIMPVMGGAAAMEAILEINPETLIVLTSGYSADADQLRSAAGKEIPLIAKPYNPDDLLRRLRDVLDG